MGAGFFSLKNQYCILTEYLLKKLPIALKKKKQTKSCMSTRGLSRNTAELYCNGLIGVNPVLLK